MGFPNPTTTTRYDHRDLKEKMLTIIYNSETPNDPTRWVWDGMKRHKISDEAEFWLLTAAGILNPAHNQLNAAAPVGAPLGLSTAQLNNIPVA